MLQSLVSLCLIIANVFAECFLRRPIASCRRKKMLNLPSEFPMPSRAQS
jgi:hypothetical protein